jgi:hypothetical protein
VTGVQTCALPILGGREFVVRESDLPQERKEFRR